MEKKHEKFVQRDFQEKVTHLQLEKKYIIF